MKLETLKKVLSNQDKNELIKIIAKLSNYSPDAEEWLLEYCSKNGNVDDANLIARKQIQHYWYIARDIIDDANAYGGTAQEDEAYDALSKIDELVQKNKLSWEFRRPIVDEMLEQFFYGNSGFDDSLIESCEIMCQSKDEKLYLAGELSKSSGGYYVGYAADLYLEYGEEDKFIELQLKNLHYGSDYIHLADYYKKKRQPEKAIKLVEEALGKADGRMDEVYEWLFREYKKKNQEDKILKLYQNALKKKWNLATMVKLMYEYYKADYDKMKPYLLQMMEVCDSREARKWYDECKKNLTEDDFGNVSKMLHKLLKDKNTHDYLQLLIEEGHLGEVLDYLKSNPSLNNSYWGADYDHNLSKQLASAYPVDIINIYWSECERLCVVSNKKNYMRAASILKEIKTICNKKNLQAEWETRFSAFKEKHKRKSLLMGYIKL